MNLGSLFPTSGSTLGAKAAARTVEQPTVACLADVMQRSKPGEFKINWPVLRQQGVKNYKVVTTVPELLEYIKRCEETGLGSFDYETAADVVERREFAEYEKEHAWLVKEAGDDDKALQQLQKDYDAALEKHLKSPLDPNRSDVCAMSIAAAQDEAVAIFIDNPGSQQFEPTYSRSKARERLMNTLEQQFFTNTKIMKIAVNLNFEQRMTARYGKYILMPVADPFLMWIRLSQLLLPHKIINPKRPFTGKGLKPMTKEIFGVVMTEFKEVLAKYGARFYDEVPCDTQDAVSYCCEDSDYGLQQYLYWDKIAQQVTCDNPIYPTYSAWLHGIEMPFARVTGLMEYWGMCWNSDMADVKRQEAIIEQEKAAQRIADIAKINFNLDINVGVAGKTKDVKSFVFDTLKVPAAAWSTKTRDSSMDGNAIMDMIFMLENKLVDPDEEKYLAAALPDNWQTINAEKDPNLDKATRQHVRIAQRAEHPYRDIAIDLLNQLQTIQKYATLLSSHIEGRERYLNKRTGRIHANYEPWTETARLASSNPNGQNVPRMDNDDLGIRNLYRAAAGKVLILEDESGFELRLTAWKSGCEIMLAAFKNHEDIHRKTACTMTGKEESEILKPERNSAKAANFGSVYGGTEHALQRTFKKAGIRKSLEECKVIVDAVMKTYPGIPRYQVAAVIMARETGFAETIFGFKRLLPAINSSDRRRRGDDERRAQNTPIQGSAADIMKKAQNAVYEKIGIDTAYFNVADRKGINTTTAKAINLPIWEGFDDDTKKLLEQQPFMRHGHTDMVAQIHDEIISEVDDDLELAQKYAAWEKAAMELAPLPNFPVQLEAEASAAYTWGAKVDFEKWVTQKGAKA